MNTKTIKFDLNKFKLYEKIKAKQGDTKSRFLLFQLLDGSAPFNLKNRSVRAYMIKPDGKEIFNDLIVNNYNLGYCTLELTNQVLAVPGTLKIELMVTEEEKKLTSSVFELEVIKSINSEKSIVSTNEFTALLNGLAALSEYDNYKNAVKEMEINKADKAKVEEKFGKVYEQLETMTKIKATQKIVQKMLNKEPVKIVCYGDSVTWGFVPKGTSGAGTQTRNPYPKTLQDLLINYYGYNEITVYNEGYSGRQSDELASDEYINYVKRHNPDLVILMVGLNDKVGNYGSVKNIQEYIHYLNIINEKLKNYEMLIMTLPPNYSGDNLDFTNQLQRINGDIYTNTIKNFATLRNIEIFDMNKFIDNYFKYGIVKRYNGQPDFLHYSDEMYINIAKCLYINKFYPVDSVISDDCKFDVHHGIFKSDNYVFYDGVVGNDDKYNLIFKNEIEIECFIDMKEKNIYIDSFKNTYIETGSFDVEVDGNIIATINNKSNGSVLGKDSLYVPNIYIATLNYGYHKIRLLPKSGECFISGIKFKDNIFNSVKGLSYLENNDNSPQTNLTFKQKYTDLKICETSIIDFSCTNKGGIGIGYSKNSFESPLLYIHFTESECQLYNADNNSWNLINKVAHNPKTTELTSEKIVITTTGNTVKIMLDTTIILESDDISILGDRSLHIVNHKSNIADTHIKTIIDKIEYIN